MDGRPCFGLVGHPLGLCCGVEEIACLIVVNKGTVGGIISVDGVVGILTGGGERSIRPRLFLRLTDLLDRDFICQTREILEVEGNGGVLNDRTISIWMS